MSSHAEIFGLALALRQDDVDEVDVTRQLVAAAEGRPTVLLAAHAHARALARELPHDANLAAVLRMLGEAVQRAAEDPEAARRAGREDPLVDFGRRVGGGTTGRDLLAEAESVAAARRALSDLARH